MITTTARNAAIVELVYDAVWSTAELAAWALGETYYGDRHAPLWEQIAETEAEARAYYAGLEADNLRWCAAEVLVDGGWDLTKINFRKS